VRWFNYQSFNQNVLFIWMKYTYKSHILSKKLLTKKKYVFEDL